MNGKIPERPDSNIPRQETALGLMGRRRAFAGESYDTDLGRRRQLFRWRAVRRLRGAEFIPFEFKLNGMNSVLLK